MPSDTEVEAAKKAWWDAVPHDEDARMRSALEAAEKVRAEERERNTVIWRSGETPPLEIYDTGINDWRPILAGEMISSEDILRKQEKEQ